MTLSDVVARLPDFDPEETIYASEPWTSQSEAISAREPAAGGLPLEASGAGMKYFLEVSIAQEFLMDWLASLDHEPTPSAICQRLIDYAANDA